MDRISRSTINSSFAHFAKAMGFRVSKGFNPRTKKNDPGLVLDYDPYNGGYVIAELNAHNTGEGRPFGDNRMSPRAFYQALWFATRAADHAKRKRSR